MSEFEIKLHVDAGRRDPLLDALGRRRMRRSALSAVYFDTPDGLLAHHGFALRLRRENGHWAQTLKGATARQQKRAEHEIAVEAPEEPMPELDLDRHRRTGVGRRLRALLRKHGKPALGESCRTEVARESRVLHAHGAAVEWALDQGEVTAGERSQPICELELELKSGEPAGLYALAHDWEALHGLWIDPVSKSERGARLARDDAFGPAVKATPPAWSAKAARTMDGEALLRRMLAACLAQVVPNAGEIALGSRDPEHVHQLRVGLRRLRSAARGMKPFASRLPAGWEPALMPVFDALGELRDEHVQSTTIARRLRKAGADVSALGEVSEEASKSVQQLVRGAAFQGALLRLLAFAEVPAGPADRDAAGAGLDHLAKQLKKLSRQVTRHARRFNDRPFEARHQVRKRLKRLRYLAEFAAPAFDAAAVKSWMRRVARAQDDLGEHVDLVLASRRVAQLEDPGAGFAADWLDAKAASSTRAVRKSLARLRKASAFW